MRRDLILLLALTASLLAPTGVAVSGGGPEGGLVWLFPKKTLSLTGDADALRAQLESVLGFQAEYWTNGSSSVDRSTSAATTEVNVTTGNATYRFRLPSAMQHGTQTIDWSDAPSGIELRYAEAATGAGVIREVLVIPKTPIEDTPDAVRGVVEALGIPVGEAAMERTSRRAILPVFISSSEAFEPSTLLICNCSEYTFSDNVSSRRLNQLQAYVADGKLAALRIAPWIDLKASGLLTPEEASRLAKERFHATEVTRTGVEFQYPTVVYDWRTETLSLRQDAADGSFLTVSGTSESADHRPVPHPGFVGIVTAVLICTTLAKRLRKALGERGHR